ncbi:D-hexose-6-phosphate mutarotase [Solimonas sp. SE-A11]|uniref:D-hexose-6-phosphate mutarotase n=1 Tax=Solimonas sp. SE-A11 TaxID=3054954 RepID=UPI00259CB50B|nr:D-hexose-6-phosphate mutarotase [Solimonas sp. SE-A11]MDM4768866.1 D-hexose-6-phosphate mutarotase [Solimonas sp. SE-A11]
MSQASPTPASNPFQPLRLRGADGARLEVLPYGAHVLSWTPAGEPHNRLFLSPAAEYRSGVSVRGGVPVVFPQFSGHGSLPKHGFARVQNWEAVEQRDSHCRLRLRESAQTLALWPHAFELQLDVSIEANRLQMALSALNTGSSAFEFTVALHSYLQVGDIHQTRLHGLRGRRYLDAVLDREHHVQHEEPLVLGEWIDRIYFDAPGELLMEEPSRRLRIRQEGFTDTVVWNPAAALTATLPDMQTDDWRRMLCVEAGTTVDPVRLEPGQRWRGAQILLAE